jgi:hypothetical protein
MVNVKKTSFSIVLSKWVSNSIGPSFIGIRDKFSLSLLLQIIALGGVPDSNNPYSCQTAGCTVNLLPNCPDELRVTNSAGQTVACRSSCNKFGTDEYCCAGAHNTPSTCNPDTWAVNSAAYFKRNCPNAYSYAYDDPSSTYTCPQNNVGYKIVFY